MPNDKKSDKSLDLTSSQFDAYKALYSRNVQLPCPNAPILDNLTKFVETDEGIILKTFSKLKVQKPEKNEPSTSTKRFQPHQEPVPGKAKRAAKNVLTRMNTVKGPLAMLQTCMDKNIRIKVLTRNMSGIRGHCSGYLVAFDKHFNIALQDVTEVWTRRKHIKSPALGPADDVDDIPQPRVRIRSSTSKTEECERFIPKLMMRGEHVAVVIATDY
uniref:Sm domain-containing protein n=1 Tax=Homalodisca liturata TaxID=320908 RepID=A0A1B6HG84_9HEMI